MALSYYEIIVTDRAGARKAWFSSSSQGLGVVSLEFSLGRDEGCLELSLGVDQNKMRGTIALGYLIEVKAKVEGGTLTTYWKGVIVDIPTSLDSDPILRYQARGIWSEVDAFLITKYYESADIDDIVKSIRLDIDTPATALVASDSEVSVATPYTIADVEAEFESAGNVIRQLALIQEDVQYGVDQNGKLFFKDYDNTVYHKYWLGKQVASLEVRQRLESIVNKVYAQSKSVVGGGNLTLTRSDATSISAYGTRAKVVQVRNTKAPADAIQYADAIVARWKDPLDEVQAELPTFKEFRFPRGKVTIYDTAGAAHTWPIIGVTYRLDETAGLVGQMTIGDVDNKTPDKIIREIIRNVELAQAGSVSLTRIEHTRGEEFVQTAIVDAKVNQRINIFTDACDNLKAFDQAASSHMVLRDNFFMGPLDFETAIYQSNVIPMGESVDSVRFSIDLDNRGRVTFDKDTDLSFFFENDVSNWQVQTDDTGLIQFQNGSTAMFYIDALGDYDSSQIPWYYPPRRQVRCYYTYVATGMGSIDFAEFIVGYKDANNYLAVHIYEDGANTNFLLVEYAGGFKTTLDSTAEAAATDFIIDVQVDETGTGANAYSARLRIYADDDSTVLYLGSWTAFTSSIASCRFVGFKNWYRAATGVFGKIRWFESILDQTSYTTRNVSVYVSRDGGTTFTSDQLGAEIGLRGIKHKEVDLSSQPSGSSLIVKMKLRHPNRIYGWSVAWV